MDGEAVSARMFRDRLTGRTPRSERGDRGSTPCPGSMGRIAESSAKQPRRGGRHGKWERWFEGSTPSRSTHSRASSSSGRALVSQTRGCWFEPSLAHCVARRLRRIAQVAERLSDTEEAAGSTPAPPTGERRGRPGFQASGPCASSFRVAGGSRRARRACSPGRGRSGAAPAPARRRRRAATKMPCAMPGSTRLRRVTVAQVGRAPA
jgi:hypothetical protein